MVAAMIFMEMIKEVLLSLKQRINKPWRRKMVFTHLLLLKGSIYILHGRFQRVEPQLKIPQAYFFGPILFE
jgi:hypothetical protein